MSLSISDLSKRYNKTKAVDSITFEVDKGCFHSLLGPNGCGKTSILRCIAGLEVPEEGEISLDGRMLFSARKGVNIPPHRREIGMVFQTYAIWPHMNVFENIALPLKTQKIRAIETKTRVRAILNILEITSMEESR